ncbi:hypothetical protein GCM10009838_52670 [Catenulispora subtropica]|uniref:Uncharacterized protein n=1 Tax=Catenulispora subtropica TaxID=450798 RepID=A0ABN2SCX7_9ACTN
MVAARLSESALASGYGLRIGTEALAVRLGADGEVEMLDG